MSQHFYYPPALGSAATTVSANQGTPNNDANAWPVRITDGTHDATVTAGGALNVAISGLANPLPVTDAAAEASLSSIDTKLSSQATAAKQDTGNASLASIDGKLTNPLPVSGPLTDVQLRASAVPISAAALPLPSGAATETTLSTLNGKVTAVNTGAVVISSSALPSGAATEATLSTLNGKVTAVNTGAVVVSSSALPSGASTEATIAARLAGALVPAAYDYISLTYTGSNVTTVLYKTGGSAGSTVKTLTLAYTGSQLDSVTAT